MAKKAKPAAKVVKRINLTDFATAYSEAKTLSAFQKKLESMTNDAWDESRISSKLASYRVKGYPFKSLIQRGWVERRRRGSVDIGEIAALLKGSDAMATAKEMPKSRK